MVVVSGGAADLIYDDIFKVANGLDEGWKATRIDFQITVKASHDQWCQWRFLIA